eukprot:scaffold474_cov169-Ochromonas_danica.AAC.18
MASEDEFEKLVPQDVKCDPDRVTYYILSEYTEQEIDDLCARWRLNQNAAKLLRKLWRLHPDRPTAPQQPPESSSPSELVELKHVSQLRIDTANHIEVIPNLKGFSKGSNLDTALKELGVAEANCLVDNSKFTECSLFDKEIDAAVRTVVVPDMLVRMRFFKPESGERISEYTCHEFVSPILLYSLNIVMDYLEEKQDKNDLILCCEKDIVGRRFHGPVDYSIMYSIFDIVLTEAKNSEMTAGLYQNLLQQHASLELLSDMFIDRNVLGKRRRENFLKKYEELKCVATAGIVTTGKVWMFNKVVIDKDDTKYIYRSNEIYLTLDSTKLNRSSTETVINEFRDSVKKLMKLICQLVLEQIKEIHNRQNVIAKYDKHFSTISLLEKQLGRGDIVQHELEDILQDENINGYNSDEIFVRQVSVEQTCATFFGIQPRFVPLDLNERLAKHHLWETQ